MSQIFDALQRSEAERAGNDSALPLDVANVLRRAERSASTKWSGQTLSNAESLEVQEIEDVRARLSAGPKEDREAALGVADVPRVDERSRILEQFPELPLSLAPENRLVAVTEEDSPAAEAFRLLGVRIRDLARTRPLKRILITSTIPQEGKTTIAVNLACTQARTTQQKVLLLEGDVRRPALSEMLRLKGNPGICDWLKGDQKLTKCVYHLAEAGIWVMPAGNAPQNPLEVLQSAKLSALLAQLAEWFDTIIIDSPPVLPLADTSVWMRLADGIILAARQGVTEKKQLQKGLEAIDPQKLIGATLNCSKNSANSYYYY